jgi:tRNA(Leu) C34 or U34 (ribose-2'-O)-methylase TrmL
MSILMSMIAKRGFATIGLSNPKHIVNIGAALRAASCYGVSMVAISGGRYKRAATDTLASYRHIPTLHNLDDVFDAIPFDTVPIAVDFVEGAVDLCTFKHPERAFYIFGPEDGTLGKKTTDRCKYSVMIPTAFCMNLAATINVILYDRMAKLRQKNGGGDGG